MRFFYVFSFLTIFISACSRKENESGLPNPDDVLRVNQIQLIASHNSYRIRTTDTILQFLQNISSALPANLDPTDLDYTHLPIEEQMSVYGVRGLEIDIYNDPAGGAFYNRHVNSFIGLDTVSNIPELLQPGFKVLHIKDVDYNTHFYTFRQFLQALKNWSDQNPGHLPLFINIETKSDSPGDQPLLASFGFRPAPLWDAASADAIDLEVQSVFGDQLDKIMTPDKLRGDLPRLEDVVLQNKWPTLGACRNKIFFIMQGDLVDYYTQNHPSLSGRAMFVYASPGSAEAAFVIRNSAKSSETEIQYLVSQGYFVRTRTDDGTDEARNGDYSKMDAAFRSGAQINSTDYYKPDSRAGQVGWTDFTVRFPNGEIARKNPVNASSVECGPVR